MIIKFDEFLTEALKLSDAKKYTQIWLNSKMQNYLQDWFKGEYRIYLPIDTDITKIKTESKLEQAIQKVLNSFEYEIETYFGNLCKKIGANKNFTKISKVLNSIIDKMTKTNDKELEETKKLYKEYNEFLNTSGTHTANDLMVVVSRHPIDIAGMSTGRGWDSCMNLEDGIEKKFVKADIEKGTIIAYLIRTDDKNIENPISRVLIKPFVDERGKSWMLPDRVYGSVNQSFVNTIEQWLESLQGKAPLGTYNLKKGLYVDSKDTRYKFLLPDYINNYISKNRLTLYHAIVDKNSIDLHFDSFTFDEKDGIKFPEGLGELRVNKECILLNISDCTNFPKYIDGVTVFRNPVGFKGLKTMFTNVVKISTNKPLSLKALKPKMFEDYLELNGTFTDINHLKGIEIRGKYTVL